jgi:hypothetical protein
VLGGNDVGVYGNLPPDPSTNVHLSNFAIFGEVTDRVDSADVNGIGGGLQDSTVSDVWIQHVKAGIWMTGPFTNLEINDVRIQDTTTDTITQGGGIQVGNRFSAVPLSGTTTIGNNTLVRTGTLDPNWKFGVGAIWFYASDGENMTGTINVDHNTILDSPYDAFGFVGDYIPKATPPAYAITNVHISDAIVRNVGRSCSSSSPPGRPRSPVWSPPGSAWTGRWPAPTASP